MRHATCLVLQVVTPVDVATLTESPLPTATIRAHTSCCEGVSRVHTAPHCCAIGPAVARQCRVLPRLTNPLHHSNTTAIRPFSLYPLP